MLKNNRKTKAKKLSHRSTHREATHRLARRALFSFLITFLIARIDVFLIMSRRIPNMYFFLHGTHIHHLNYGIFLLSVTAGYSIFRRPTGVGARIMAFGYGIAMALTFDEFGMWLHLGGSYWQRASVDAVIVIAALIGLAAFAKTIARFEARHFWSFLVLLLVLLLFISVLFETGNKLGNLVGKNLEELEASSSS